ncbi:MAG: glyceraldehyde-3-phosphate dehydrogenase [Rhodobacteraceae bacterium]|nr:glyceraldehyde-3-phosphate dehydrogenase [Paracoccaceae bacterium]
MTNRVAIWLALLILLALILDYVMGYGATLFLARQFLALIEWVAFWR